ncbi:MAG TPA: dihydrofolate reductase family protein, partial [Pyrinomonadaceae bacterium]|nr:dihydrofolate reductase family protein [Pyrinomonadaceae bacterium]
VTGPESRARVHELRHAYDAILVGAGTVVKDDPLLTDRSGLPRRRPLVRVVLDDKVRLSPESKLATTTCEAPVLVFGRVQRDDLKGVELVNTDSRDLELVLLELGRRSIQSVFVEGGATVAGAFIDAGLVNKVSAFIAPKIIGGSEAPTAVGGEGVEDIAEALELERVDVIRHGRDIEVTGYPAGQTT